MSSWKEDKKEASTSIVIPKFDVFDDSTLLHQPLDETANNETQFDQETRSDLETHHESKTRSCVKTQIDANLADGKPVEVFSSHLDSLETVPTVDLAGRLLRLSGTSDGGRINQVDANQGTASSTGANDASGGVGHVGAGGGVAVSGAVISGASSGDSDPGGVVSGAMGASTGVVLGAIGASTGESSAAAIVTGAVGTNNNKSKEILEEESQDGLAGALIEDRDADSDGALERIPLGKRLISIFKRTASTPRLATEELRTSNFDICATSTPKIHRVNNKKLKNYNLIFAIQNHHGYLLKCFHNR